MNSTHLSTEAEMVDSSSSSSFRLFLSCTWERMVSRTEKMIEFCKGAGQVGLTVLEGGLVVEQVLRHLQAQGDGADDASGHGERVAHGANSMNGACSGLPGNNIV